MVAPRLRPVFDPMLREPIRRRLAAYYAPAGHPRGLYRQGEAPYRWPASRAAQAAGVAVLVAGGALLGLWAYQVTAVAIVTLAALLVLPVPVRSLARMDGGWAGAGWMVVAAGSLTAAGLSIFAGEEHHPWLPGVVIEPGVSVHDAACWAVGVFVLVGAAMLGRPTHPALLAARHRSRYRLPEDFEPAGRRRLLRVQAVGDRVREARRELGSSFDAGEAVESLKELEWRIAVRLGELRGERVRLDEELREAATDRVRRALRPRGDALDAAYAAIDRVVSEVEAYGEDVRRAVIADREYRQLSRIAAEGREAPWGGPIGDDLLPGAEETAAVRQAREELVQRLVREQTGWDDLLR